MQSVSAEGGNATLIAGPGEETENGAFPRTAPYPLEYLWLPVGQESGSTSYKNVLKPFCGALALLRVVPECEVL